MLIMIREGFFFRKYEKFGYITNKILMKERVVNETGAIIFSALSKTPREFKDIIIDISNYFSEVPDDFEKDIIDFLSIMEQDEFIVTGDNLKEIEIKEQKLNSSNKFVYDHDKGVNGLNIIRSNVSSGDYLNNYFKNNPCLLSLQLEITSLCNERCIHCYIPHGNKIKKMDYSLFKKIIEQANDLGVINIGISGGEPLMHDRFCDFIDFLKNYDFSIRLLSNLTLLGDKEIKCIKNSNSLVAVSLYATNPIIHDSITKLQGSCDRTMSSIQKLIDNNISVVINCPIMKENVNEVEHVLEWGSKNTIKVVTDPTMMARCDGTTDNLDHRATQKDIEYVIDKIIKNDDVYKKHITEFKSIINKNKKSREEKAEEILCGACFSSASVTVEGDVNPCAGWQNYKLGNLKDTKLRDIWTGGKAIDYIRKLRRADFPKCLDCEDEAFCSICMARNYNESLTNDPLEINEYMCKVARVNRRLVEMC